MDNIIEQIKDALVTEDDMRKVFSSTIELSNGTKVASVELRKGKIDALTQKGYETLDDLDLDTEDWENILRQI